MSAGLKKPLYQTSEKVLIMVHDDFLVNQCTKYSRGADYRFQ